MSSRIGSIQGDIIQAADTTPFTDIPGFLKGGKLPCLYLSNLLTCLLVDELPLSPLGPLRECLLSVVIRTSIFSPIHFHLGGSHHRSSVVFAASLEGKHCIYIFHCVWNVIQISNRLSLGYRKNFSSPLSWKVLVSDSRRSGRGGTEPFIVMFLFEIWNILLT